MTNELQNMGIHSMIDYMIQTGKGFEGFDSLSIVVEVDGKKLRLRKTYSGFTMSVKDFRAIETNQEQMY